MRKCVLMLFDESQMFLLGSELAKICTVSCVIYLNGCIGTGKSVFCKGFLKAFGCVNYVKSPTYTLVESYFLSGRYIYHVDCYRLSSTEELMYMDIRDNADEQSIFLIEWPPDQKINVLPQPDIIITISYSHSEYSRKVMIESVTNFGVVIMNCVLCTKKFKYEINM